MLAWVSTKFVCALPLAASAPSALVVIVLCAVGGVGTALLLPSRREASIRTVGGIILLVAGLTAAALMARQAAASFADIYFWIFSAIAVASALRVISHPRPVYSALYFVLTVLASAGLFVLLWAEFMAAALVLIYAGAILITYIFVIMLAQQTHGPDAQGGADYDQHSREPLAATALGFVLMAVMLIVIFDKAQGLRPRPGTAAGSVASLREGVAIKPDTVQELAAYLFVDQVANLELAGLILTVAMVGAVMVARRRFGPAPAPPTVDAGPVPAEDNPHAIPVYGTRNPRAKEYPQQ